MGQLGIYANAEKIVEGIHNHSRSQIEIWQRIPLLALEADGRTGFSDDYSRAYREGFWALGGSVNKGYFSVYVDLSDGKLVDARSASSMFPVNGFDISKKSVLRSARNEEVLKLAYNLDELDAQKIVNSLEEESKEAYSSCYDPKKQETWRNEIREELSLQELYVRQ